MGNVASRKAQYDVTNVKNEAPVEDSGQIKAMNADPVNGDVGDKAGNEEGPR